MTSTAPTKKMTPVELINMVLDISESMSARVKAISVMKDETLDEAAQECFDELVAFIDKHRSKPTIGENYQSYCTHREAAKRIKQVATKAEEFSELVGQAVFQGYGQLKESPAHDAFVKKIEFLIAEGLINPPFGIAPMASSVGECKNLCAPREYNSPHGRRLSKLGELCKTLADTVEDNDGNTYKIRQMDERATVGLLLDLLVDSDVLPLKSARKLDGISLSQLQGLISAPVITLNTPKITIKASGEIVTGGIDVAG